MKRYGLAGLVVACAVLQAGGAARSAPLVLKGKWVLDARGKAVGPESFRRGLQPSALAFRDGELWSLGDQRSQYPGHLFRIDPRSGRLVAPPIRLRLPEAREGENPHFRTYRRIPNSDFEGLTVDPHRPSRLFAVTEDKVPWVVEIDLLDASGETILPRISGLSEIRFPGALEPWDGNPNFRVEGITISDDGRTAYLAFERASDDLPRILVFALEKARTSTVLAPRVIPIPFGKLPRRADKSRARLNINDIQFLRWKGVPHLLAVARDQERLLAIDLENRRLSRSVELELLDPDGNAILWVSPEGLAFDVKKDRLWIINDPDSMRGNYRRLGSESAAAEYADYAPLLFETSLSAVLGDAPSAGEKGASSESRKE